MNSNLVTGQRTFCISVSGAGLANNVLQSITFPFNDSAGNPMRCNYFSVVATTIQNSQGGVLVEVIGPPHEGSVALNDNGVPTIPAAMHASGVCGFYTSLGYGQGQSQNQEWHGSQGEIATGCIVHLNVEHAMAAKVRIGVTYGNLLPLNSGRLAESYDRGL